MWTHVDTRISVSLFVPLPWVSEELHRPNRQNHTVASRDATRCHQHGTNKTNKWEGHAHTKKWGGRGREEPQGEWQNHQNRNCGSTSCRANCHIYCAPNENSIPVGLREMMPWSTKKGETKLHLALFTGALVLEEKCIQGSQNNHSVPPWYPYREEKSLREGMLSSLEKGGGDDYRGGGGG